MFTRFIKWSASLSMLNKGLMFGLAIYLILFPIGSIFYIYQVNSGNIQSLQVAGRIAISSAVSFLQNKDTSSACSVLQLAAGESGIRYYTIRTGDLDICYGPESVEPKTFLGLLQDHVDKKLINLKQTPVESTNYTIIYSEFLNSWNTFWIYLQKKIPTMLLTMTLFLLIVGSVLWILILPLRAISKRIAKREIGTSDSLKALGESREYQLLNRATDASDAQIQELQRTISFIAKDFSSYLIPKSNLELPYVFNAAFLRFDINGYTRLYFKHDKVKIAKIISHIARDVDEIANRYGGFHYSFGGDEFIDVFDGEDGIVRAYFAARAIFSLSEKFDSTLGTKIRFKAAIHKDSQSLFDKIPQCYTLTSDSLVFTARFFDAVEDKDNNSLMICEKDLPAIQEYSYVEGGETFNFKNVETPMQVFKVSLAESSEIYSNSVMIPYLRTDADIIHLLEVARHSDGLVRSAILKALKEIPIAIGSTEVRDAWLTALIDFDSSGNFVVLSSFINTGRNLIPSEIFTPEIVKHLQNLKSLVDARVEADVIELLAIKIRAVEFQDWIKSRSTPCKHHRTNGNILIAEALNNLSGPFFKDVREMINSSDANASATGVFVASVVLRHYRERDPVKLSQYLQVNKLVLEIEGLTKSKNEMVSNRAKVELDKIRSARVV